MTNLNKETARDLSSASVGVGKKEVCDNAITFNKMLPLLTQSFKNIVSTNGSYQLEEVVCSALIRSIAGMMSSASKSIDVKMSEANYILESYDGNEFATSKLENGSLYIAQLENQIEILKELEAIACTFYRESFGKGYVPYAKQVYTTKVNSNTDIRKFYEDRIKAKQQAKA